MILSSLLVCHLALPAAAEPWRALDEMSNGRLLGLVRSGEPHAARLALSAGIADDSPVYASLGDPVIFRAAPVAFVAEPKLLLSREVSVGTAHFATRTSWGGNDSPQAVLPRFAAGAPATDVFALATLAPDICGETHGLADNILGAQENGASQAVVMQPPLLNPPLGAGAPPGARRPELAPALAGGVDSGPSHALKELGDDWVALNPREALGDPSLMEKTVGVAPTHLATAHVGLTLSAIPNPSLAEVSAATKDAAAALHVDAAASVPSSPAAPTQPGVPSLGAPIPAYALLTFAPGSTAMAHDLKAGALASGTGAVKHAVENLRPALPHLAALLPTMAAKKGRSLPNLTPLTHFASNVSLVMGNISLRKHADGPAPVQGGTISMSFSNVDVAQALVALGEKTGANIVYAGKDKSTITLKLVANSTEEAVRAISSAAGLVYRRLEKVYVVATPDGMKAALAPYASTRVFNLGPGQALAMAPKVQESLPYATATAIGDTVVVKGAPEDISEAARIIQRLSDRNQELNPTSEVIMLNHAKADDIAKAVKLVYPDVDVVGAPGPGDAPGLIRISGPAALVDQAKATIQKMDDHAPGAKPEDPVVALPYHIKYTSAPELVDLLKKAMPEVEATAGPEVYQPPKATFNPLSSTFFGSGGGGGGGGGGSTGAQGNQGQGGAQGGSQGGASGGGSSASTRKPGDRAADLIIRGPRSMVLQAIALLDSLDLKPIQIWVDVTVSDVSPSFTENLGVDWNLNNTITAGERGGVGASGLGVGKITRSPYTFQATLNASIRKGEAKLIADPKVQVSDNDDASVFIGQTFNIVLTTTGALGATTQNTTSIPVGVILLIHPRVNADGNITLHVNPVVSTVDSVVNGLPQTSNREAETTLVVKDGQTMLIGGLIKDEYSRSISEVPFLSKIPIIGELFRNRNTNKTRQDVLISITPHIVKD